MDRSSELLPGASQELEKRCLHIGQPSTPAAAVSWLTEYLSGRGSVYLDPSKVDPDETLAKAVARRLSPVDHDAARRALHDAFAVKAAGMSPGAVAAIAYAEMRRGHPSPPSPGEAVVSEALRLFRAAGEFPPDLVDVLDFSRQHAVCGVGSVGSVFDRVARVLDARYGLKISGEVVYRLSRAARGENVRAQDRPIVTLFGSAMPPAPGRLPRDRALTGELL
jgi:hypothetical protein